MIAFATLFLGLVLGARPVEVTAGSGVASVEFVLDGASAARISRSPWRATVDFGAELSPHELVARALDADGREISQVRQWLNVPRPAAELQILVDRNEAGTARTARLVWGSLLPGPPQSLSVTVDGRALAVTGREPFALPAYDPGTTHLLSASAEFENGVRCRADTVLGGQTATETASALTAVPLRVGRDRPLPDAASLTGALLQHGERVRAVAVERGPAQLFIVRDVSELESRARYGLGRSLGTGSMGVLGGPRGAVPQTLDPSKDLFRIGDEDRIRMIWPVARMLTTEAGNAELFETSRTFAGRDTGILWLLTRVSRPGDAGPDRRFADATAVAGLQALESSNRRAVVLLLGRKSEDKSHLTPRQVRDYLARIHVPLFVWSLETPRADRIQAWGSVADVSASVKLRLAIEKLNAELESQAIVWVEGRHLPQDITLAPGAPPGLDIVHGPPF